MICGRMLPLDTSQSLVQHSSGAARDMFKEAMKLLKRFVLFLRATAFVSFWQRGVCQASPLVFTILKAQTCWHHWKREARLQTVASEESSVQADSL